MIQQALRWSGMCMGMMCVCHCICRFLQSVCVPMCFHGDACFHTSVLLSVSSCVMFVCMKHPFPIIPRSTRYLFPPPLLTSEAMLKNVPEMFIHGNCEH